MKNKQERFGLILKLIVIVNAVFIIAMIFLNTGAARSTTTREEPCAKAKKINADALNSISIKLM